MSSKLQIESASMLTALYCVTMIQAEIYQLFQGRACTTLKIQSAEYKVKVIEI